MYLRGVFVEGVIKRVVRLTVAILEYCRVTAVFVGIGKNDHFTVHDGYDFRFAKLTLELV